MTTVEKVLLSYGLNKNESKVFLSLIDLGGAFAKDLIQKTKFHKNIVYENLYKLIEKGLVSEILLENKKYFYCESPQVIDEYVKKKTRGVSRI